MKKAVGVFVVLAALAMGCIQPVQERPAAPEPGVLQVTLDGSAARTVLPTGYAENSLYYTLAFTPVDGPAVEVAGKVYESIAIGSASGEFSLVAGTWNLEVKGFRSPGDAADPGNALVSGSQNGIVISAAAGTSVDVRLVPDESKLTLTQFSTGTLGYTVSSPDNLYISQAVLTIFNAEMDTELTSVDLRASKTGTVELASGVYNLDIALYAGSGRIAVKGLTAHIYDGLTTRVLENFAEEDFVDGGEITDFSLGNGTDTFQGMINQTTCSIVVFVPPATDTSALTAVIEHTGLFISSDPATPDYAGPVMYTVTREDGTSKTYTVQLKVNEISSVAELFSLLAGLWGNTAASPFPVKLNVNLADTTNSWLNILTTIQSMTTKKYIDLDLSGCTMAGTEFDPDSFEWGKHYITGLVLPNGATEIKAGSGSSTPTFKYFTNLKTLSASGVVHIGDYAFYNCDSLTTVSLPTAATIGDYAFYGCDNLTLWQVTITFDADGGSPATQTKTVNIGSSVGTANWPSTPTRSGYLFNGWYTSTNGGGTQVTASTMVNGNITVYAKWSIFADLFLDEALTCLSLSAVDGGAYTITLKRNETIAPRTLYYASKTVSITIKGDSTNRTVSLSSNGSLFTIGSGVTLTLDNNVTLQGRSNNSNSLVLVESGGTLVMNTGSKVSDNRIDTLDETGGGVHVSAAGKFTMNGGTISGNVTTSASGGGGVQVSATGKFTMNGGTISGNATSSYGGGGVQVRSGTFVMNGGTISGNATFFSFSSYGGGGVYVTGGIFTMSGGTISDNTAGRRGGGVHVSAGTFNMAGGAISGNTAAEYGGGVYVTGTEYGSTFNKTAGIIYGDTNTTHTEGSTENTAESDGHAVYVNSSPAKKRNTTAGTGVTLNSGGYSDGWE